ncbi:beta-1,3-glucanosyltransferase [Metarhizium album ARSEF 1941]|uniref:1,3-beta-glucanosyltransferase n=1 Tax=Metarhizium album (strain ARSEF 1941) TaxID=1081103 RepID=A0A0B2WMG0_METAS|nr:beta-1,3-glucanosyltransferase [Metarhizium album ARSEF 1941]KHN97231.1 beta-1,3-glucanosyltransferase [Metarhizium album ARSEF 1941]
MGLANLSWGLLAIAGSAVAAEFQPIIAKGSKFFYQNGTQFYIKGIAYQQEFSPGASTTASGNFIDSGADELACKRDGPILKEAGASTLRFYGSDPAANHDACMRVFRDLGLYVIIDIGVPGKSINRDDPHWDIDLYEHFTAVIDTMSQYDNVIGFIAGNEVSNSKNNTEASAYVKAAIRDMRAYIKNNKKITRQLFVGVAANHDPDILEPLVQYFACDDGTDFFGINVYSWCGKSSIRQSGYDQLSKLFENYTVPVMFAEYGCNTVGGGANRFFHETTALYSEDMTRVFSGGFVYMYHQEANDYGLVEVSNGKATKLKAFYALKKKLNEAKPKTMEISDYTPGGKANECPELADNWRANKRLPRTPDKSLCYCAFDTRGCVGNSDISAKRTSDIFGYICGESPEICASIDGNATTGRYGIFSMCSAREKLAVVVDGHYNKQKKAKDACNFGGSVHIQSAKSERSCTAALAKASSDADKKGATAMDTDDSFAVHGAPVAHVLAIGDFSIGLYMLVALCVGAGMVAL